MTAAPFGFPAEGAPGPGPEQRECHYRNRHKEDLSNTGRSLFRSSGLKGQNGLFHRLTVFNLVLQRTSTSQPSHLYSFSFSRSRATFRSIFGTQYPVLVSGILAPSLHVCRCQKQPRTSIIFQRITLSIGDFEQFAGHMRLPGS
jgi:hypothetical protein